MSFDVTHLARKNRGFQRFGGQYIVLRRRPARRAYGATQESCRRSKFPVVSVYYDRSAAASNVLVGPCRSSTIVATWRSAPSERMPRRQRLQNQPPVCYCHCHRTSCDRYGNTTGRTADYFDPKKTTSQDAMERKDSAPVGRNSNFDNLKTVSEKSTITCPTYAECELELVGQRILPTSIDFSRIFREIKDIDLSETLRQHYMRSLPY